MVALANDWRLAEERAWRFMNPARVVERYRQISDGTCRPLAPCPSYQQMLTAVVKHDLGNSEPSDAAARLGSE